LAAPPTFLEGVGANHRMRNGRLTPSRKVREMPLPLLAPNMKTPSATHAAAAKSKWGHYNTVRQLCTADIAPTGLIQIWGANRQRRLFCAQYTRRFDQNKIRLLQ
jgi:hypothetical protein